MAGYRLLYSLRIEHDYFDQWVCPAINLTATASAQNLMKRRGLMFKQMNINEWEVIYIGSNPEFDMFPDVLTFKMSISDAAFFHYTVWDGFKPATSYRLTLPSTETDATKVIKPTDEKRQIHSGFCSIELNLTDNKFKTMAIVEVLKFSSKEMYWEYYFILSNSEAISHRKFVLREENNNILFSTFETTEIYGHRAIRCRSEGKIKMISNYGFRLTLEEKIPNSSGTRKTLMKNVSYPIIGNFVHKQEDTLVNICYL